MAVIFLVYSWCKLLAVNLKSFTKPNAVFYVCLVPMETLCNKSSRQIAMCLNEFNVQIKLIQLVLTFFNSAFSWSFPVPILEEMPLYDYCTHMQCIIIHINIHKPKTCAK